MPNVAAVPGQDQRRLQSGHAHADLRSRTSTRLGFQVPAKTTIYYPTIRVDCNATENLRFFALLRRRPRPTADLANTPQFPGGIDPLDYVSNNGNNRIAGFGVDWAIRPTLINQFHAGYMYQLSIFDVGEPGHSICPISTGRIWPYGLTSLYGNAYPRRPISSFYPLLNAIDSVNWQRGCHSFVFGGSWFREQDHYWNGPGGEPNYTFGLDAQDPAVQRHQHRPGGAEHHHSGQRPLALRPAGSARLAASTSASAARSIPRPASTSRSAPTTSTKCSRPPDSGRRIAGASSPT